MKQEFKSQHGFIPLEKSHPKVAEATRFRRGRSLTGFTLIETLIYSLLVSFIISTSLVAVYQILKNSDSLSGKTSTEQEAVLIAAKIKWALNGISAVNSPLPNTSDTALSVNKNGLSNPVILDLSGTNFRIKRGSASPLSVNSSRVKVSNLTFSFTRTTTGSVQTDTITAIFYVDGKDYKITKLLK